MRELRPERVGIQAFDPMSNKRHAVLASPVFWIALVSAIWTVVFVLDAAPILRGGPDWAWNFKPVLDRYRVVPLFTGLTLYIALGLWLRAQRNPWALLGWSVIGGVGLTLAAVHLRGDILYRLYTITVSGRSAGWHMAAAHIADVGTTLRNWPQFMSDSLAYSPHIDHSPPGIVLLYFWASHALDRVPALANSLAQPVRWLLCQYIVGYSAGQYASAWLGILMPVWASFTTLPLYALGRQVYGEDSARWAVLWWPLVPGFLMFSPLPNTFYALPSLMAILLLWKGLDENRLAWVVAAALLMSLLTFLTFTFVPLLLMAGLLTLGAYWLKTRRGDGTDPGRLWPFKVGLAFGVGLSVVWLIFYAASGLSFWNMWQTAQQTQIDIAQVRAYAPWVLLDLNDLFMFTGWPLILLALIAVGMGLRTLRAKGTSNAAVMTLAALITLIVIDLYGTPRGEWGRIMIFMSPWLLLAAGSQLGTVKWAGGVITAVQGATACAMVICLQVLAPEFRAHAAPVPPGTTLPASSQAVDTGDVTFGTSLRLVGAEGKLESQSASTGTQTSTLLLWLTWKTQGPVNAQYAYSIQVVSADGRPLGTAIEVSPMADAFPTACWRSSIGPLVDRIKIPVGQDGAPISVDLSLIDSSTGYRLGTLSPGGVESDRIRLGPFDEGVGP